MAEIISIRKDENNTLRSLVVTDKGNFIIECWKASTRRITTEDGERVAVCYNPLAYIRTRL